VVTKKLTINAPIEFGLSTAETKLPAQLIFEFDERYPDPIVEFGANSLTKVPAQTSIEFRGKGKVILSDGVHVTLEKTAVAGTENATFIVTDSAIMQVEKTAIISGTGSILVDQGAMISIEGGQQLVIGDADADNLVVNVARNSFINVDAINQGGVPAAKLSFQKATYNISFEQGGTLHIGQGGVVEINALDGASQPGNLTKLSFANAGYLEVDCAGALPVGTLRFGKNRLNVGQEPTLTFDAVAGTIEGYGMIEYVDPTMVNPMLSGRLYNRNIRRLTVTPMQLVETLINTVPALTTAAVFVDVTGNQWLITKKSKIVPLKLNDQIRSDNATSGMVYGSNQGVAFTITPDGKRT
jgi:hypothetical protein